MRACRLIAIWPEQQKPAGIPMVAHPSFFTPPTPLPFVTASFFHTRALHIHSNNRQPCSLNACISSFRAFLHSFSLSLSVPCLVAITYVPCSRLHLCARNIPQIRPSRPMEAGTGARSMQPHHPIHQPTKSPSGSLTGTGSTSSERRG